MRLSIRIKNILYNENDDDDDFFVMNKEASNGK